MKKVYLLIIAIFLFAGCNTSSTKTEISNHRMELVPEPDKEERLKYEAVEKLKESQCIIENPDTSVAGIELRNLKSTISVIGKKDKISESGQYTFYSKLESETLTLTQHPGDGKYEISIFNVKRSSKASLGFRILNVDSFKTEKGISIGMNKKQIIEKLGKCYTAKDSTNNYIELYYKIESPKDTKTKLLAKNNMPLYYASYKLYKNKLDEYEFGFEYP